MIWKGLFFGIHLLCILFYSSFEFNYLCIILCLGLRSKPGIKVGLCEILVLIVEKQKQYYVSHLYIHLYYLHNITSKQDMAHLFIHTQSLVVFLCICFTQYIMSSKKLYFYLVQQAVQDLLYFVSLHYIKQIGLHINMSIMLITTYIYSVHQHTYMEV